jgi:REP element-mobilizing transposase RayT
MPRAARSIVGGYAYHVLNRANGRLRLFKKPADFLAFEQILAEVHQRVPLRILGYTLMGNHWHFVVWPRRGQDAEVSEFFRRCSLRFVMVPMGLKVGKFLAWRCRGSESCCPDGNDEQKGAKFGKTLVLLLPWQLLRAFVPFGLWSSGCAVFFAICYQTCPRSSRQGWQRIAGG